MYWLGYLFAMSAIWMQSDGLIGHRIEYWLVCCRRSITVNNETMNLTTNYTKYKIQLSRYRAKIKFLKKILIPQLGISNRWPRSVRASDLPSRFREQAFSFLEMLSITIGCRWLVYLFITQLRQKNPSNHNVGRNVFCWWLLHIASIVEK